MAQNSENPADGRWLHPATGALILGLDWLLFTSNFATAGTAILLTTLGGGSLAAALTYFVQRRYSGDTRGAAILKALGAGACVGAPLPIGGTLVGGLILSVSGLSALRGRLLKR